MTANGTPLEDTIAEARRVADAAHAQKLGVKLLGGAGIHLHSPSAQHAPLKRKYGDLDYVISTKDRKRALAFFPALGYEANDRFNLMQGDRRLYFYDGSNGKQGKDMVDLTALLLDHPIKPQDDEAIDPTYVARLAAEDWGMYRTLQINIGKLRHTVDELDVDRDLVKSRLDELWEAVGAQAKPLKWRMRAQVGDRMRWYELPEEVRSPYQPE